MICLGLETSTPQGGVAIVEDGVLRFEESFLSERGHSSLLFALIERACAAVPRIDRITVGLGPGSYAGIRIAIAAGIGLSLATGAELVGVPSPAALPVEADEFVVIGDARRGTFYWTEVVRGLCRVGPELVEEAEFRARLKRNRRPVYGSEPLPEELGARLLYPTAVLLAGAEEGIVQRGALEPIYLREPHITPPKVR